MPLHETQKISECYCRKTQRAHIYLRSIGSYFRYLKQYSYYSTNKAY
uniref:Uncharacterized protein n=1 Tax=Arundo donax TaxID=35708 RepID=A0A0A9G9I3_ARUDO